MATQAQTNANRKNAKKSTGPKTAEGKEASSQNAVKHGLFVKKAVVHDESQEEYDRHREAMLADWNPVGEMERIVTERLVNLSWRLQRAQRMQDQAIDYLGLKQLGSIDREHFEDMYRDANDLFYSDEPPVPKDYMLLGRLAVKDWANYRVLDRMIMYERRIESSMYRAMRELERLQKAREAAQPSWRGLSLGSARDRPALESTGASEKFQSRFVAETKPNQPHLHPDKRHRDEAATRRHNGDFAKRTQLTPDFIDTMSCATRDYNNQPHLERSGNKANRSQTSVAPTGKTAVNQPDSGNKRQLPDGIEV